MFQLADRFQTPVPVMEDLPPEDIWEHLAYLIITHDPIGKRYMDALREQDPRGAEQFQRMLQEARYGGREK